MDLAPGRLTTGLTASAILCLELLYFGLDGSVGSEHDVNYERIYGDFSINQASTEGLPLQLTCELPKPALLPTCQQVPAA